MAVSITSFFRLISLNGVARCDPSSNRWHRSSTRKSRLMHTLGVPRGFYGGVDASYPIVVDWDAMKGDAVEQMIRFLGLDESFQQEVRAVAVTGSSR